MRHISYLLSIVIITISSCQKDLGTENFFNLEADYGLSITQELSTNGGLASLEIKTSQELDCSNYSLPYRLIIESNHIELNIDKVRIEGDCIAESSIVSETVDFKLANAEKDIEITLQDAVSNEGKIKINDDEIYLELESNDGLKINKAKINRIKKNMMWCKIKNGKSQSISQLTSYFDEISNNQEFAKGDYGIFYINNLFDLQYYDEVSSGNSSNYLTFAFYSETDFSKIEETVLEIKENDPSLVFNMTIYNGQTINII